MEMQIEAMMKTLAGLMTENLWFAPLLSLAAGILTSFTPCSLSAVPMALAYLEGTDAKASRKAGRLSLVMALGMAVAFGVFGCLASVIGHWMHEVGEWWGFFMGVLMILMALQMWGIICLFPGSGRKHSHDEHGHKHESEHACHSCRQPAMTRKGYVGAFCTGALGGFFASHCAAPVMVALLALVAQAEHGPFWGIFLMVLYAAGHSILLVLAGTSYSVVEGWLENPRYAKISRKLRGVVGAIILCIGIFMLFL